MRMLRHILLVAPFLIGRCRSFIDGRMLDPAGSRCITQLHSKKISFALRPSITSIPSEDWNSCLQEESSPFLEHAWLSCLEESGCASPATGWAPQHVCIQIDDQTLGYVPLYIKGHSMGEFIFDNSWADAAYQSGITYYPKLLVAVPFTPATGHRILLKPEVWETFRDTEISQVRKAVATFLIQVAESNQLSSIHFNFLTESEATELSGSLPRLKSLGSDSEGDEQQQSFSNQVKDILNRISMNKGSGYLRRTSIQYHWTNENSNNGGQPYASFDDYLSCFKSKRRITIKRERRLVLEEEGIRIDSVMGADILKYDGLVERMFEIYLSTVDKMIWGRQYLTLDFFQRLAKSDFIRNLCFLCARPRSSGEELRAEDVFAGTFNIVKNGVFYGRYWGCLPGREIKNLHFETCYWSAIEFCIKNNIGRMEPGAGGGGK
jgi:predicted N-acyltransferase